MRLVVLESIEHAAPIPYLKIMPCSHCLNARKATRRAVVAAVRGDFRNAYAAAKEAVSEVRQSDEAKRVRMLLTRKR